jgi:GNAT superfamily N-acetyltransferase
MQATILRVTDKFPEPEFSHLQRTVFADIQLESIALSEVLSSEREATFEAAKVSHSPMVRLGAYVEGQLVGWSCGWLERGNCFYMANSGVTPQYQGEGIYSALLQVMLEHARELGAHIVRSQHSVLNNRIIVCKLKRGFHISGLSFSAQLGNLVELVHHLSEPRLELLRSRVIPLVAPR